MSTVENRIFSTKDPAEEWNCGFEFSEVDGTITTSAVSITRLRGSADAAPGDMLAGSPTIDGDTVIQHVIGGVDGTDYELRCTADTSGGEKLVLVGRLPVRTARA